MWESLKRLLSSSREKSAYDLLSGAQGLRSAPKSHLLDNFNAANAGSAETDMLPKKVKKK